MTESKEYSTIVECEGLLETALKSDREIAQFLHQQGFITTENYDVVISPRSMLSVADKAGILVEGIRDKVRLNSNNYKKFIEHLVKNETRYGDILRILDDKKRAMKGPLAARTQLQLDTTQSKPIPNTSPLSSPNESSEGTSSMLASPPPSSGSFSASMTQSSSNCATVSNDNSGICYSIIILLLATLIAVLISWWSFSKIPCQEDPIVYHFTELKDKACSQLYSEDNISCLISILKKHDETAYKLAPYIYRLTWTCDFPKIMDSDWNNKYYNKILSDISAKAICNNCGLLEPYKLNTSLNESRLYIRLLELCGHNMERYADSTYIDDDYLHVKAESLWHIIRKSRGISKTEEIQLKLDDKWLSKFISLIKDMPSNKSELIFFGLRNFYDSNNEIAIHDLKDALNDRSSSSCKEMHDALIHLTLYQIYTKRNDSPAANKSLNAVLKTNFQRSNIACYAKMKEIIIPFLLVIGEKELADSIDSSEKHHCEKIKSSSDFCYYLKNSSPILSPILSSSMFLHVSITIIIMESY